MTLFLNILICWTLATLAIAFIDLQYWRRTCMQWRAVGNEAIKDLKRSDDLKDSYKALSRARLQRLEELEAKSSRKALS